MCQGGPRGGRGMVKQDVGVGGRRGAPGAGGRSGVPGVPGRPKEHGGPPVNLSIARRTGHFYYVLLDTSAMMANPTATAFAPAVVAAVQASLDATCSAFFTEPPRLLPVGPGKREDPCIAGIIAFFGEESFS